MHWTERVRDRAFELPPHGLTQLTLRSIEGFPHIDEIFYIFVKLTFIIGPHAHFSTRLIREDFESKTQIQALSAGIVLFRSEMHALTATIPYLLLRGLQKKCPCALVVALLSDDHRNQMGQT